VHEENVKGTYDEDTRPDEEYELANTVEVDKVERYYAVEERKLVEFDKKVVIVFDGWWKI